MADAPEPERPDETWYLAICQDCAPVLPQPFTNEVDRDTWAVAHREGTLAVLGSPHEVWTATETRR